MLIKLNDFNAKTTFFLDVRNIRVIQINQQQAPRASTKKDEVVALVKPTAPTTIVTYTMLPGGFQAFDVVEEAEDVARAVNAAWQGKSLLIN
jgi:hypothetical protein